MWRFHAKVLTTLGGFEMSPVRRSCLIAKRTSLSTRKHDERRYHGVFVLSGGGQGGWEGGKQAVSLNTFGNE